MKWLLIGFALAALWFSTVAGYTGNRDVISSIRLLILVATGLKAYYSVGRRQAFWIAFFAVVLATAYNEDFHVPNVTWASDLSEFLASSPPLVDTTDDLFGPSQPPSPISGLTYITVKLFVTLLLATAAGFMGIAIYDQSRKSADG
jgi:hypothetical protein